MTTSLSMDEPHVQLTNQHSFKQTTPQFAQILQGPGRIQDCDIIVCFRDIINHRVFDINPPSHDNINSSGFWSYFISKLSSSSSP